jgi:hypothetical protein
MGQNNGKAHKPSMGSLFGISTIYGRAGEHDEPYMTRIWFGRLRLHIFYRGDNDPDCHDHPWDFWTFPLTPYVEEVLVAIRDAIPEGTKPRPQRYQRVRQVVPAFQWTFRKATHTHRVLGRAYKSNGKIVTIVWRGKGERPWGFIKDREGRWCWVTWKEYVLGGGKDSPCGHE